jgi:hypothetical protein
MKMSGAAYVDSDPTFFELYEDLLIDYIKNGNTEIGKRLTKINQLSNDDIYLTEKLSDIHEKYYNFYSDYSVEDLLYIIDIYSKIDALLNQNTIADIIANFDELAYRASQTKRMKTKAYYYFDKILNKALIYYVEFVLKYLRSNILILDDLGLLDQEFIDLLKEYSELYPYPQGIIGAVLYGHRPTEKDLIIYTNYILKYYIK